MRGRPRAPIADKKLKLSATQIGGRMQSESESSQKQKFKSQIDSWMHYEKSIGDQVNELAFSQALVETY